MKIAVLMGGTSEEREISIRTGAGVSKALLSLGHEVITLDTGTGALLRAGELKAALGNPAGPSVPRMPLEGASAKPPPVAADKRLTDKLP